MSFPNIRIDLFPAAAEVTQVNGLTAAYPSARVIVTDDEAWVFADSPTGPKAFWHGRLDAFEGKNTIGYTATLADESILKFRRSGGCGCGSRLRGFRPFTVMTQGQVVE